ncbi:MAG: GyrI-like domain-containing protein [Planctomycetaceae bacterium]|nr:GyrI-like domain-containing protein [Planctomycetaceae bacterium]
MPLEITVKELPGRKLVGMVIRTNMQKASTDCHAVWQTFMPRVTALSGGADIDESFGVSVMVSQDGTFDYWAAVEMSVDTPLPEDMVALELPGGLYACAVVPNLSQVAEAYGTMYMEWPQQQSEYAADMQAPCVEVYRGRWTPDDPVELWVPVLKKV